MKLESVLFPISEISNKTIQKKLSKTQFFNLVCYSTKHKQNIQLIEEDILFFTSPSNVKAYFNNFKLLPHQKAFGIGKTTTKCLNDLKL